MSAARVASIDELGGEHWDSGLEWRPVRHHLGIEVPAGVHLTVAGETRSWKQGRCLAFDDSFAHAVRHEGESRRVVLIVDTWHPELTAAEAAFVAEVQRLFYPPRGAAAASRARAKAR